VESGARIQCFQGLAGASGVVLKNAIHCLGSLGKMRYLAGFHKGSRKAKMSN